MCCSRKRCWCRCRSAACSIEGEGGLSDIVISEFMDEAAVAGLGVRFSVLYDPALVDNAEALCGALAEARALIMPTRTPVTAPLLPTAPQHDALGRPGRWH